MNKLYSQHSTTSSNTYLLTYFLTPWSRVLLEKLTGSAASQEIPRIFGTRSFLTVLPSARHLSLTWANSIQSPQPPPTSWRSFLILSSNHLQILLFHITADCSKGTSSLLTAWNGKEGGLDWTWCNHPNFLNFGTTWRSVVTFTPLPFHPWENNPKQKDWYGRSGDRKNLSLLKQVDPRALGRDQSLVCTPNELC